MSLPGSQRAVPDPTARLGLPEAFCDEDGTRWFIEGAVADHTARLAFLAHILECGCLWNYTGREQDAARTALAVTVESKWYRPKKGDDEMFTTCREGHPDGSPWTIIEERAR